MACGTSAKENELPLPEMFADDPNSVFQYGESLRYTGQQALAAEQYRRVLELDPEHATAGARLAAVSG